MTIREKVALAPLTSYHIGGEADYFAEPETIEDLTAVTTWLRQHPQPYYLLGDGTNVLFSSQGYRGLIIKPNFKNIIFSDQIVTVGCNYKLADLLDESLRHNLIGL